MFGFGKKKEPAPSSRRSVADKEKNKAQTKAQLNLFGVPGLHDADIDLEVDDDDIENELLALMGEGAGIPKKSRPRAPPPPTSSAAIDPFSIPNYEINSGNESENDDDDEIDDEELEAELGQLTGAVSLGNNEVKPQIPKPEPPTSSLNIVETLQERLILYEKAKLYADTANDTSKSRRFGRAIKTLQDLLKQAKLGKVINETEIPPIVSTGEKKVAPFPPPTEVTRHDEKRNPVLPSPLITQPTTENESFSANIENEDEKPSKIHSFLPPANTFQGSSPPIIPVFEPIPQIPLTPQIESSISEPQIVVEHQIDPLVEQRLKDYKKMAVGLKRAGDPQGGLKYLKLAKALEGAINSGTVVDLSIFPSIDEENKPLSSSSTIEVVREDEKLVSAPTPPITNVLTGESEGESLQLPNEIFAGPEPPKTIMEALQQRLDKYRSEVEKANAASNGSKARRMGRIVKQYEEAISLYKKGKPVVYDELPTPPGFGPIPIPSNSGGSVSAIGGGGNGSTGPAQSIQNILPPSPQITHPPPKTELPSVSDVSPNKLPKPNNDDGPAKTTSSSPSAGTTSTAGSVTRPGKPSTKLTLQEKQLAAILQRQKLFKEAALNAKKNGNIEQAREYLRISKGFDKLIQASQAGLPVDMNTLPSPPEAVAALESEDFELVSGEDCIELSGTMADVFTKLEEDLKNQIKISMRTRDHYKSVGDIASANRFEKLALESKRDLDTLRLAAKQGTSIPKYHYESRIFSITECNTDLTADEIEVNIIQGVNYRVTNPADVDTFVKVELPYPSAEEAQFNKTVVIKDTNNPAYNTVFKMTINRTARNFQRFIHRHGIKFEVWSRGGFLRSNTLIGQGVAKLLSLETKCTIHEAVDLVDGRKPVGKLEVKIRLREPVLTKQITQKKEKWLSIDRV